MAPSLKISLSKKKRKRKRKIAKLVFVMFSSGYCRNRYHPRGAWSRNALFAETILPFASRPRRKGASSPRAARRGRDARKNGGGRGLRDAVGGTRTRKPFSSTSGRGENEEERRRGWYGIRRLRVVIIINLSGI